MLHLADDENGTLAEIATALQITHEDCLATLESLEQQKLLCCCIRLIDGKAVERWTIFWRRTEARKYFEKSS
jgi:hypothetical protein